MIYTPPNQKQAAFVNVRSSDESFQNALSGAMNTLGPLLCQSLARNFGGNASRSELDKLSEPLKKLINRHPRAKEWLEAGLHHPTFPSNKVSQTEKSMFVKKVARFELTTLAAYVTMADLYTVSAALVPPTK